MSKTSKDVFMDGGMMGMAENQGLSSNNRLLVFAGIAFALHLVGNPHYGYFRDELYFIACGFRPAWGYVDQPPLTPLMAAGSQLFGHSLFLLRAVPAIFSAASIYITCLLVIEFGGGVFAQILATLVAFFCPVLMNFGMKVSTDMLGLALWPLAALFLVRAVKSESRTNWIYAGLALGLSFQAKISVIFFAAAIFMGLILTSHRRVLRSRWFWCGVLVSAFVSLPYFLWQLQHDFPMLELLRNGQTGKNLILTPVEFGLAQIVITNPALAFVWIAGVFWLARHAAWRFLAFGWLVLMIEMIILHGKHYYPANIYPILIAAGAVAIESWTNGVQAWRHGITAVVVAAGLVFVPFVMPILPVEAFASYARVIAPILHLEASKTENHRDGRLPQDWADMHGWPELATTVGKVYESLTPVERSKAVIVASNYGQAAAIEFFGHEFGLPPVLSGHNQYYLWGTRGKAGEVLIDVNGNCGNELNLYQSAVLVATFIHPLVMPYENEIPIMVCRGLNKPLAEIWPATRYYR
jgi:hypothetical protein